MSADLELTEYRSLTPAAVVGLILGLLSPVAFLSPFLVAVPLAGLVLSLMALRQIAASDGSVVGRPAAIVGLFLATICAVAIPARAAGTQWLMRRQAQPIAEEWFRFLAEGNPQAAIELKTDPAARKAVDPSLVDYYASDEGAYERLHDFVEDPTIRALLALGDRATVRYYNDEGFGWLSGGRLQIAQNYAVTFRESPDEEPTTFFVLLSLQKDLPTTTSPGGWRILDHKGGVRPEK